MRRRGCCGTTLCSIQSVPSHRWTLKWGWGGRVSKEMWFWNRHQQLLEDARMAMCAVPKTSKSPFQCTVSIKIASCTRRDKGSFARRWQGSMYGGCVESWWKTFEHLNGLKVRAFAAAITVFDGIIKCGKLVVFFDLPVKTRNEISILFLAMKYAQTTVLAKSIIQEHKNVEISRS